MDRSKKFILMCKKAFDDIDFPETTSLCVFNKEIHKVIDEQWSQDRSCGVWTGSFLLSIHNGRDAWSNPIMQQEWIDSEEVSPIYSQDQLQEKVNDNNLTALLQDFISWLAKECNLPMHMTSMEQLWLAFVMQEKYNKTWNGKDWVKERAE